jgi:hypothetical protein
MNAIRLRDAAASTIQGFAMPAFPRGISASQFAVAWVLNNALVTGTIAGPRTFERWEHYLGALEYKFTTEDEALVDRLVAPGHPSTPGYNDPAYPSRAASRAAADVLDARPRNARQALKRRQKKERDEQAERSDGGPIK